jgi:hypothetical protein
MMNAMRTETDNRYAAREWLSLDWSAATALGLSDNRARLFPASV